MEVVNITVSPNIARLYNNISSEEQLKIQALMSIWIKNADTGNRDILGEVMDAMSDEAQKRGLTPEILEEILADES